VGQEEKEQSFRLMLSVTVQVKNSGWKAALRPCDKTVRLACEAAFAGVKPRKRGHYEICVVLAGDAFIKKLNKAYRGKDKATNVLSFPGEGGYLGDIVLALETVKREAREQKKISRDHATHLLVHGTLHLLGYDHMLTRDAEVMERKEIKILKVLGVENPYL